MITRVELAQRVVDFLHTLAPEPRRALWRGIKGLAKGAGDCRQLEGPLAPYWRLRVRHMRVIYAIKVDKGQRIILCFYANYRDTVCDLVAQLLASELIEELRNL